MSCPACCNEPYSEFGKGVVTFAMTIYGSFLRTLICLFALFYYPTAYPILQAVFQIGWLAGFGIRWGIETDPMLILLGFFLNWWSGEISWKKNMGTFLLALLNFLGAAGSAALAGWIAILLNGGTTLPIGLVPQDNVGHGLVTFFFMQMIGALIIYTVYALVGLYSRDGYGALPARFFLTAAVSVVIFRLNVDTVDFGLSIGTWIFATTGVTPAVWWIVFLAEIAAGVLTFILFIVAFYHFAGKHIKAKDSRGDAVVYDSLRAYIDVEEGCKVEPGFKMVRDPDYAPDVESKGRHRVGGGGGFKAL